MRYMSITYWLVCHPRTVEFGLHINYREMYDFNPIMSWASWKSQHVHYYLSLNKTVVSTARSQSSSSKYIWYATSTSAEQT